ncbi:hypothetical protein [Demetria terragena]|uniref:hypothetical protein n=1 Tax=Demetria terragena TaxID=63959 RepID=UPI00035D9A7D|nr:hypothetical protein [Demetria terragena]
MIALPGDLFARIADICQPFKAGDRFRALPGMQLWVPGGKVNAPAQLLPDVGEPETDHAARLAASGVESFALRIVEPWADDPMWWQWMRDLVQPIWHERGTPVLPVDVELVYSHGLAPQVIHAPDQESYVWLLSGTTTPPSATETTHLAPGEDPMWTGTPSATWLRMLVGTDSRRVVAEAAETVAAELDGVFGTSATPYVPWSENGREVAAYREVATHVAESVGDPDHPRRLMAHWLKRCSASGLEPVPAPRRSRASWGADDRLHRTTTILHATVGAELLCAANGHLFAVKDPSLSELIRRINDAPDITVAALAQHTPERVVHAILDRLYRIHAMEVKS